MWTREHATARLYVRERIASKHTGYIVEAPSIATIMKITTGSRRVART